MNFAAKLFKLNWVNTSVSAVVFLVGWNIYSGLDFYAHFLDTVSTATKVNRSKLEEAVYQHNFIAVRNLIGQIKTKGITFIRFSPSNVGSDQSSETITLGDDRKDFFEKSYDLKVFSNGAEIGHLEYYVDLKYILLQTTIQNLPFGFAAVFFMLVITVFSNLGTIKSLSFLERQLLQLEKISSDQERAQFLISASTHSKSVSNDPIVHSFLKLATRYFEQLDRVSMIQNELKVTQSLTELASQVAHDIRSPIAALSVIEKELSGLEEDKRILLRSAIGRIKDIANNLLEKYRHSSKKPAPLPSRVVFIPSLISTMIESIVSEKRWLHRKKNRISLTFEYGQDSYGLFALLDPIEFKRVIANLIENSFDAIESTGTIQIDFFKDKFNIDIIISDSGRGIPAEVLSKLGHEKITHQKEFGTGLGFYHAKKIIVSFGGELNLESAIGIGTKVTIKLPTCSHPNWFCPEINLNKIRNVIVVDDDPSIHHVWDARIKILLTKTVKLNLFNFYDPLSFEKWVIQNDSVDNLYLVDFEFFEHRENGLDLIAKLNISKNSVLVTSQFEKPLVVQKCAALDIKIIPKNDAAWVPIVV